MPPTIYTNGKVVRVNGTNPGPAAGITYDVQVNMPGGGVASWFGVVPSVGRPRGNYDVRAAPVGSEILAGVSGSQYVSFWIFEEPDTEECPTGFIE